MNGTRLSRVLLSVASVRIERKDNCNMQESSSEAEGSCKLVRLTKSLIQLGTLLGGDRD